MDCLRWLDWLDWLDWPGSMSRLDSSGIGFFGLTGRIGMIGLARLLAERDGSSYSTEKCLCRITVIRPTDVVALLAFAP